MIWFTADTHFGDRSMINGDADDTCNWSGIKRDFRSVADMDCHLIDRINDCVKQDDVLYHLGNFCSDKGSLSYWYMLGEYRRLINCKYIVFIPGVFDRKHYIRKYYSDVFFNLYNYHEITSDGRHFCLFHYPIRDWNGLNNGSIHLHGNTYGKMECKGKSLDVGVDNIYKLFGGDYRPVNINEVIKLMNIQEIESEID